MAVYHTPVMLDEVLGALNVKAAGIYADLTFGGGGHSKAILKHLKTGLLVSFDQDTDALANVPENKRFVPVHGNFRFLSQYLRYLGIKEVDGVLADLGVSMHQFDEPARGFTYRSNAPLDMRMNHSASFTAADLLNTSDEDRLTKIFRDNADIPFARRLAASVVRFRTRQKFETTGQLADCVSPFCRPAEKNKILSRVFQALRIEVNAEFDALKEMLPQAAACLKKNGRLVVLTYHSAEDRIVKNFFRTGNTEGHEETDIMGRKQQQALRPVNSKPVLPSAEEMEKNPASRSAKLRIAEKI